MEAPMRQWIACIVALFLLLPTAGQAGKPGKGKKGKDHKGAADDVDVTIVFNDSERDFVRTYFVETHGRGKCPPGLAKKNNGCLPPGQAKKRYAVGRPVPRGVVVLPLPLTLERRIGPPPRGYQYGIVDGDLLKLAVGTLLVVDAVDGFVD